MQCQRIERGSGHEEFGKAVPAPRLEIWLARIKELEQARVGSPESEKRWTQ